jgi:hypothetical protein
MLPTCVARLDSNLCFFQGGNFSEIKRRTMGVYKIYK